MAMMLVGVASASAAGPWPREAGGVFLAFSVEQGRDDSRHTGLYAEYGMSARTTLGLELGHTESEQTALWWWQRRLDDGAGADRMTFSLGAGGLRRDGRLRPMGQVALSWGRGFDTLPLLRRIDGGGWLSVDGRLKAAGLAGADEGGASAGSLTPEFTAKADVTLGWKATPVLMVINQIRLEDRGDGISAKWALSAVRDVSGPLKVELGAIIPLAGEGEQALRLGTWLEF